MGTKIVTKKIRIKDAIGGEFVKSFNTETKQPEFKEILKAHDVRVEHKDQIKIVFENGSFTTSNWHPTLIKVGDNFIYRRADEIKIGDVTIDGNNEETKVVEIDNQPMISELYSDLTVDINNNYYCSDDGESFHVVHNTRKGAISVYLEPWHMDIVDFIDLKKNSGEERRRAHDLFPALWINDLFMERVNEDGYWTLFDPYDTEILSELDGDEFKAKYEEIELDDSINKNTMKAKDLWKKILTSYFESGSPFLCYKDEANKRNPNDHVGRIRSSNLCVAGDTKIQILINDENISVINIEELEGLIEIHENIKTLSMNIETGEKEWKLITDYALMNKSAKVMKITYKDKEITCTPEHKIFTSNRGYVLAKDLVETDKLVLE